MSEESWQSCQALKPRTDSNLESKDYALSYNFAYAVTNQCLSFNFRQKMVSHLINTRTLLGIHFVSLFTKYLVQELTRHKVPSNLVHRFT